MRSMLYRIECKIGILFDSSHLACPTSPNKLTSQLSWFRTTVFQTIVTTKSSCGIHEWQRGHVLTCGQERSPEIDRKRERKETRSMDGCASLLLLENDADGFFFQRDDRRRRRTSIQTRGPREQTLVDDPSLRSIRGLSWTTPPCDPFTVHPRSIPCVLVRG